MPRAGVEPGHAGGAYADPQLRDVRFVDYSRPGFAVVYAREAEPEAPQERRLALRESRLGAVFDPPNLALGTGEILQITNATGSPQLLSIPALGRARTLAPRATLSVAVEAAGELEVFLLGGQERSARVFAAPGRWVRTTPDGRWTLPDLAPGRYTLAAWRYRFPETQLAVAVEAGVTTRLDLEIRVDSPDEARDARR